MRHVPRVALLQYIASLWWKWDSGGSHRSKRPPCKPIAIIAYLRFLFLRTRVDLHEPTRSSDVTSESRRSTSHLLPSSVLSLLVRGWDSIAWIWIPQEEPTQTRACMLARLNTFLPIGFVGQAWTTSSFAGIVRPARGTCIGRMRSVVQSP